MRILVIEDEELLAAAVVEMLRDECYAVDLAADGGTAEELAAINSYDLIVLDWTIPAPTGIELLAQWRRGGQDTPVLMLTGRAEIADRVGGLDAGADDYLTKPFAMDELLARVRSLMRRRGRPLVATLAADDLLMDRAAHTVTIGGEPVELSPKEFAVLEYFLMRKGEVVTRTELAEHAWDEAYDSMSNLIDVTIHRLRRKIDGPRHGRLLQTLKGIGYLLRDTRS